MTNHKLFPTNICKMAANIQFGQMDPETTMKEAECLEVLDKSPLGGRGERTLAEWG